MTTSRERARRLHDKLHGMHADDCADMCSEIIALALDEARSAAIEECAKVAEEMRAQAMQEWCDLRAGKYGNTKGTWAAIHNRAGQTTGHEILAGQIRALKGTP